MKLLECCLKVGNTASHPSIQPSISHVTSILEGATTDRTDKRFTVSWTRNLKVDALFSLFVASPCNIPLWSGGFKTFFFALLI